MDRFEAMKVFVRIVEVGSFAAAADGLGISTTATSRLMAQLEAHLQTRLLQRSTRRLSLTESGRIFHERCIQLLADLAEAEEIASASPVSLRGALRVAAPIGFGLSHLAPAIAEYSPLHPELTIDVSLSDRVVDLIGEGLDLAIRIGEIGSQNVVARPLGSTRLVLCASPSYLARHGEPENPEALSDHACLIYSYASVGDCWTFRRGEEAHPIRIKGRIRADNGDLLAALAVQGQGITLAPDFLVRRALASGELVPLLTAWQTSRLEIHAVYPTRRHLSAAVRSFADHMAGYLRRHCGEAQSSSEWQQPPSP